MSISRSGCSPTAMTRSTRTTPRKPTRMSLGLRYLSIGLRTPSVALLDPWEDGGAALQIGHPDGDAAQVVVHEAAVGTDPRKLAVVLRGFLQRHIDEAFVFVQKRCQAVELVDGARQWGTSARQQVGDGGRAVAQRLDGSADRVAVGRQLGRQPFEPIQCDRKPFTFVVQGAKDGAEVVDDLLQCGVVVSQGI